MHYTQGKWDGNEGSNVNQFEAWNLIFTLFFLSSISATSTEKTVDSRWRAVNYVHGMYDEEKKEVQLFFSEYDVCKKGPGLRTSFINDVQPSVLLDPPERL